MLGKQIKIQVYNCINETFEEYLKAMGPENTKVHYENYSAIIYP
jgi:hypothetical protein